jgi:radical SAM superfamily enzyme YgiQ (UPF0313 family)
MNFNMRVLLINPFYPISETPSPPLGLAFLAAALEQAGVEVKVLDFVVFPFKTDILESELNQFRPQIVGVTAVTMSFNKAMESLKAVKEINPEILTVMGGPHVTFCAEDTLNRHPELDVVVLGEGEETIVALTEAFRGDRDWSHVKGIVFRRGTEVVSTGFRPFVDVDSLPLPARHLIPMGRYKALGMPVSMTSSRGCPFKCIFCVGRKMVGSRVRYRNAKDVVDELEFLNTLGFHQINLADDLFTANRKHCLAVCDEIIARGLDVKWTSFARVDTVSPEMLERMKAAGCSAVSFGVESGNADMLKRIKKGITLDQVTKAVEMCNAAGLTPHASFILGLPGETPDTLRQSVSFGEQLKDMGVSHGFHLLAPFPGTEVRDNIERYDLNILTDDWSQYHANRAIVETTSVKPSMLNQVVIEWEEKFDEWLGILDRKYKSGEATKEEAWPLLKLEHTVIIYDLMMNRVIEEKGFRQKEDQTGFQVDALKILIDQLIHTVDYPEEKIENTLIYAVEEDFLRQTETDRTIQWEWVDYL